MAALVVKLVDTQDLKSCGQQCSCGFKSRLGHIKIKADSKELAFFVWHNVGTNRLHHREVAQLITLANTDIH